MEGSHAGQGSDGYFRQFALVFHSVAPGRREAAALSWRVQGAGPDAGVFAGTSRDQPAGDGGIARIRPPSASELLERLAAGGLVERRVNEADRRSLQVFLTEKGAKLADHVGRNRQREAAELLEGFSEAERAQLARLLEKLAVSLKKQTAFAGGDEEGEPGHGGACGCGGHGGCFSHAAGEEREADGPEGNRRRHGCGCGGMRGKRRGNMAI